MKVAIVTDFLTKFGGAQRVLLEIHKLFPEAPIYCLLYDEEGTKGKFKNCDIRPSTLQKLPRFLRRPKYLISSLPKTIETFNFDKYDLLLSSSDSFSHGAITKPTTTHICYCHTPMRYSWDWYHEYLKENKIGFGLKGLLIRLIIHKIRIWDKIASDRPDLYIANSKNVQARIRKYYHLDSEVIYPPTNIDRIKFDEKRKKEDFYLLVSRLEPYKKVDLAVKAFNKLKKPLYIIGEGTHLNELKKLANDNIKFLGWQSDEAMFDFYGRAKCFIFPGEEDFGITPVEAMAAGTPVIAFGKGGTTESVIENETGLFFNEESSESLAEAVNLFEKNISMFNPKACHQRALSFSEENFDKNYLNLIKQMTNDKKD